MEFFTGAMLNKKGLPSVNKNYTALNLMRMLVIYVLLTIYEAYLAFDSYRKGSPTIGMLALFCAIITALGSCVVVVCRFGKRSHKVIPHITVVVGCIVFWVTYGIFFYTGGTGGTSIFLVFLAAPISFYFFNMV
ncbi:MAG: hypothetical protein IK152_01585 [Lachnospiraceae bacterium]|nr:hypothetical protein [Lachnospiraceae bacterium]